MLWRLYDRATSRITVKPIDNRMAKPITQKHIADSFSRIQDFLSERSRSFMQKLLKEYPIYVEPVSVRTTKRGDFRGACGKRCERITINKCGNPYGFLITLIHEIAHAKAFQEYGNSIRPHGSEWLHTYSALLHRSVSEGCFLEEMREVIRHLAFHPTRTRPYSVELALRKYDTFDVRPLLSELPEGALFAAGEGEIYQKGRLLQHRFHCQSLDGRKFRVSPCFRVAAMFAMKDGQLEKISDFAAETQKRRQKFEEWEMYWGYLDDDGTDSPSEGSDESAREYFK